MCNLLRVILSRVEKTTSSVLFRGLVGVTLVNGSRFFGSFAGSRLAVWWSVFCWL